jgi:hypothetical protein
VRFRTLTIATLVALSPVLLTACQSKIGEAASVNGHRISDNEVASYVSGAGADPSAAAAAQSKVQPRTQALEQLVQVRVFQDTLAQRGGEPTDKQLAAGRAKVTTLSDRALTKRLESLGFTGRAEQLFLRNAELQYVLARRVKATQLSDLVAAVRKAGVAVTVSGRYGRWRPKALAIDARGAAGLPGFVSFGPRATAAAGPVSSR